MVATTFCLSPLPTCLNILSASFLLSCLSADFNLLPSVSGGERKNWTAIPPCLPILPSCVATILLLR